MSNVIFILSAQRSGSTLLRLTLDKLPETISLPETFFWHFKKSYKHLDPGREKDRQEIAHKWCRYFTIKKWQVDHRLLEERLVADGKSWKSVFELTIQEFFRFNQIATNEGLVLVEKSPSHIFCKKEILEDYPDAKFLYLIRDPRDQAASLKSCAWSTSNVFTIARVWRKGIRMISNQEDKMVIKYEDLVSYPDATVKNISDFINVPYESFGNKIEDDSSITMGSQRLEKHGNSLEPISKKYISKWKDKLSVPDYDLEIIQYVCKREMEAFNYKLAPARENFTFYVRLFYGFLGLVFAKLLSR